MLDDLKNKFIYRSCFASAIACLLYFFVEIFSNHALIYERIHFPIIATLLIISAFRLKKYNDQRFFDFFFLSYFFTFFIFRISQLGGYTSLRVQWYYLISFCLVAMYNFKLTFFYYAYFIISLTGLHVFGYASNVEGNVIIAGLLFFTISTLMLVISYFFDKLFENSKIQEHKIEHFKFLSNLRNALLHEINNPLSIVLSLSEILNSKKEDELYQKLLKNSIRMRDVMSKIRSVEKLEDLDIKDHLKESTPELSDLKPTKKDG